MADNDKIKKKPKNKKHNSRTVVEPTTTTTTTATSPIEVNDGSCQHLIAYYKEFRLESFNLVHAFFSASINEDARRQKVSEAFYRKPLPQVADRMPNFI